MDALKFARISSASSVCDDSRGQAATSVLEHFEVGGEGAPMVVVVVVVVVAVGVDVTPGGC